MKRKIISLTNVVLKRWAKKTKEFQTPQICTLCSREEFGCILKRELNRAERSGQVFSVFDFDIGDVETNGELDRDYILFPF